MNIKEVISNNRRTFISIIIPLIVMVLLLFYSFYFLAIPKFEKYLLQSKKQMIKELTMTVYSGIQDEYRKALRGEITEQEAKEESIEHIQTLRYGQEQKDYFWINDTRPVMIMHPYLPELEGEDVSNFTDPKGKRMFMEMVEIAKNGGEGYLYYMWYRPGDSTKIIPKISYIKHFEPWNWIVGTGIYKDDIKEYVDSVISSFTWISTIVLSFVVMFIGFVIYKSRQIDRIGKQAVDELKHTEQELSEIFDNTTQFIGKLDPEGRIVKVNAVSLDYAGTNHEELVNSYLWETKLCCCPKQYKDKIKQAVKDAANGKSQVFEIQTNDGNGSQCSKKRYIIFSIKPLTGFGGKVKALLYEGRDITDRVIAEKSLKASEEKFKELNNAKDKFFSIIAHDLRSPFNGITGLLLELKNDWDNIRDLEKRSLVDVITRSAENVSVLLENLLDWSRLQRKMVKFSPKTLNAKFLVTHVFNDLFSAANNKSIKLVDEVHPDIEVYGDEMMVLAILRNMISNSIKFTEESGTVKVTVSAKHDYSEFQIIDNGIGIEQENMKKIFILEEDYKTQGTKDEKGSGLGLILCKDFIEKHGGEIDVDSKPGEGTTFIFTLPNKNHIS